MKCPICGVAELIHYARDRSYKGETSLIPSVTGEFCPACDEVAGWMGDSWSIFVGEESIYDPSSIIFQEFSRRDKYLDTGGALTLLERVSEDLFKLATQKARSSAA